MLACTGLLPRRIARCVHARQPSNKRFFVQSLCDGFLDLAIALPFPPSVPSYSATIILVTVASRVALFPLALWVSGHLQGNPECFVDRHTGPKQSEALGGCRSA